MAQSSPPELETVRAEALSWMAAHGFRYKRCVKALKAKGLEAEYDQVKAWGQAARAAGQGSKAGHGDANPAKPQRGAERRTDPCPVPFGEMDADMRSLLRKGLLLSARLAAGQDRDGNPIDKPSPRDLKDAATALRILSQTYPEATKADEHLGRMGQGGGEGGGADVAGVLAALELDVPGADEG